MKFCADAAEVIRAMAENAESAESDGSTIYDFSEWLAVCADIKKSLRAVDDSIPERYPNRMIADLSDAPLPLALQQAHSFGIRLAALVNKCVNAILYFFIASVWKVKRLSNF